MSDPEPDTALVTVPRSAFGGGLVEEQALYEDLVDAQPGGIYRLRVRLGSPPTAEEWRGAVDASYTVEFVSARLAEILGIRRADFERNPGLIPDLIVPEDRPGFDAANVEAIAARSAFRWEGRMAVRGEVRWIRFESRPRLLENGDVIWTGLVEDVTESRRAAEALRESEATYRGLFDHMLNGFAWCRLLFEDGEPADFVFLTVNRAFEALTGLVGVTGRRVSEVIPGIRATSPDLFEAYGRVVLTGRPERFESYVRSLGEWFSISVYSPAREHFVVLFEVVSERKRAEQRQKDTERELEAHRERLEELVAERTSELVRKQQLLDETSHLSRVGGWEYDLGTNELTWTDVTYEIHEAERDFRPTVESGIGFYAPESRARIAEVFGSAVTSGEPFDEELQLVTARGNRLWVRAIGHPYVEDGKIVRVSGVFQDIQSRRLADDDLKRYRDRLEELVAARTTELQQSEARLLEAQSVAHLGSWAWDAREDKVSGSEGFYRLFGVPPEGIGSLPQFLALLHEEDRPVVEGAVALALEGDGRYRVDYRVKRLDGGWRHLEARGFVVFDGERNPVRMVGTCLDISDLTEAEESLRTANERLRRDEDLLNETGRMAKVGGWELDLATNRLAWTEETCRIHEVPPGFEPTVESAIGFYHPEDRPIIAEAVRRAAEVGQPFDVNLRIVTALGRELWVEALGRVEFRDGVAVRVCGALQDVTQRRQAAEEREASSRLVASQRELLEAMLGSMPVGIVLFRGADYVVEMLNPAYQAIAPGKEMVGKKLAEIWPELIEHLRPIFDRVRDTGVPYGAFDAPFELRRTKDGSLEPAWFNWTLVRTPIPGADEWGVLVSAVETTEQVKAHRAMDILQERLVLAQEASGSGTWDWDIESGRLAWSPEFFRLFGLDPSAQTSSFETWRAVVHPDDREKAEARIGRSISDHVPLVQAYRIVLPGRDVRWIEARGNTTYDASGLPRRMSGLCFDITERVAIEEELKAHREHLAELVKDRTAELEVANRELESFSYSVSHDLRAPLRALDGFSAALLDEYPDRLDEKGRHYLERIKAAAERMGELINSILDLSRLSRQEIRSARVDLTALAQEVAGELRASSPEREVEFRIAEGLEAQGDSRLLCAVLQNLMGNAFKFTSHRPRAWIEVGSAVQCGETVFHVKDNGVGFDMAWAGKLFTPFQRLHGPSEFPGSGIGLATVHRIIGRHNGRIWPDASVDGGAVFSFTIGRSHA